MDLDELEVRYRRDMDEGYQPFLVVGSAGTVSTGAVDPLEIWRRSAASANSGSMSTAPMGVRSGRRRSARGSRGTALADSVAVDPHKWLYAPLEAGCALVRNPAALRNAFSYHPPYYSFEVEAMNYFDIGPQNSRGFRALKIWLALQHAGAAGYREMIQDDIILARYLYDLAPDHPELEAITHHLSITTLRYVPRELRASLGVRRRKAI